MDLVRKSLAPGRIHVMGGSWGSTLAMEWLITRRGEYDYVTAEDVAAYVAARPGRRERDHSGRRAPGLCRQRRRDGGCHPPFPAKGRSL